MSPKGPVRSGFVGPKMARAGVPTAAAMCMGPESFAMSRSTASKIPPISNRDVFPAKLVQGPSRVLSMSRHTEMSSGPPSSVMDA